MQFKNRYMIFEVFLDPNGDLKMKEDPVRLTSFNIYKAIKDSFLVNFGECGLASTIGSFQVKYVNHITKLCIVRSSREEYQKLWSAITMVRSVGNCPVVFNFLDSSGNIRACKAAALKYEEMKFEQHKLLVGSSLLPAESVEMHNYLEKLKCLDV